MGMTLNDFQIKVKVNQQYAELVRPLSNKEYTELRESIKEKGLHLPIIINQDNTILDGHHRYQICNELGIDPKYEVKTFEDLLEEKSFVIDINLLRRQLNDFQKAELGYKLEEIESEKARLRELSKLKNVKDKLSLSSIEDNDKKGRVVDIVSKKVGVSRGTYERAKNIIKYGSEVVKEKLRHGKISVNYAFQMVNRARDHKAENIPQLPQGQFGIILADPPWQYEFPARGNAQNHYATMELEEICNMDIPSSDDSILFCGLLWLNWKNH